MFENYQICPYTGLRSFTEDEALYFKGREEDIDQATIQLQRNKFLMLTGASGDGKSSLVYAGIIPNARAGFLKSKYTQWCVANFRPERTPFQNLCGTLSKELHIANSYAVQGELNHGFSSLVDLYKNSKRFIDIHSSTWQQADDKEKAVMKREAANLIILIDQFEEFFTNPENYHQGAPSRDANLVLNLLLETARISLEEDLPVYVIFTMRSDYIGQCAAFRGLPEYIGFSQFFVPRLNRSQLQQVIEEPAKLSGNRISRRLTERLIHDITEGVDQLPILQHALNQIWVAAGHGNQEMDLLHYAMVGGMGVNELPDEQVSFFHEWFTILPPEIKACYHAPNLQNVLDTHTNKLYEQAAMYFTDKTGHVITSEQAKSIIRVAFTCLTKIDQGRAVRNRMTLQEITNIAGNPAFEPAAVGILLNIFREPGNTFIHPFITDDNPESRSLQPDQVLDITHESLIRNWQYLGQWALEEFDSYSISLDFEKQLDRWILSKKSNNFLLSIGPLTYFESWFNKARPNAYWIARYLPGESGKEIKLNHANEILNHSREFLKRSARSHIITRTIMRYGTRRIAVTLAIVALITLSSFAVRDYFRKQNSHVLNSIHQQTLTIAGDPAVSSLSKSALIAEELKLGQTTLDKVVNAVHDPVQQINVVNGIASLLILQGRDEPKKEITRCLFLSDSLLEALPYPGDDLAKLDPALTEINLLRVILDLGYYYDPTPQIEEWRKRNADRSARWSYKIIQKQPPYFNDIQNLNLALENAINHRSFSGDELTNLLSILSPFENGLQTEWLKSNFNRDRFLVRGSEGINYGFTHNGLYQELAYLYAATGNTEKALQCMDSLLAYSQNNFQGDYAGGGDNASNIAAVYYLCGKVDQLDGFVSGYCHRKKISTEEFYARLLGRTFHGNATTANLRLFPFMDEIINLNLAFSNWDQLGFFYQKYREAVQSYTTDPDQKNFLMALSFKNEGIEKSLVIHPTGNKDSAVNDLFDKALSFYRNIDSSFLAKGIQVPDISSSDIEIMPRKFLFVYPDIKTSFHPEEPRSFYFYYFSDAFMKYILANHLFDSFYPDQSDLSYLSTWLTSFNVKNIFIAAFFAYHPRYEVLQKLSAAIENRHLSAGIDLNLLYLYLGFYAQRMDSTQEMLHDYDKVEWSNIPDILRLKEFGGFVNDMSLSLVGFAMKGYIEAGRFDKAVQITTIFHNPVNRSSLYAFTAVELLKEKKDTKLIQQLIDSARKEMDRVESTTGNQPNRRLLAYALTMQHPSDNVKESFRLIKNLPAKFAAVQSICRSFAFHGNLYGATERIPDAISGSDQADFLRIILLDYSRENSNEAAAWEEFMNNYQRIFIQFIQYIDENN